MNAPHVCSNAAAESMNSDVIETSSRRGTSVVFGLSIESPISLPETVQAAHAGNNDPVDVTIAEQQLRDEDFRDFRPSDWFGIQGRVLRLRIEGVGRFEVAKGDTIRFERDPTVPAPGVGDADVRIFLLGSCLGAILQQRGTVPLHASTAVIEGAAVAFMGPSGAGKSTTLAMLVADGHAMLSDDVSALQVDANVIKVLPAYGQVKLNPDSVEHLQLERDKLTWINRFRSKFALDCTSKLGAQAAPLETVFVIEPSATTTGVTVDPVHGSERFALLHRNTYRQVFHDGLGIRELAGLRMAALANRCRVFRLTRPTRLDQGGEELRECVYRALAGDFG